MGPSAHTLSPYLTFTIPIRPSVLFRIGKRLNCRASFGLNKRREGAPNIGLSAAAIDVAAAASDATDVLNDRKSSGTEQIGLTYVRPLPDIVTWSHCGYHFL